MKNGKVAVITGASSGIGAVTALLLAKSGHSIVLGARRIERIESLVAQIKCFGGNTACRVWMFPINRVCSTFRNLPFKRSIALMFG